MNIELGTCDRLRARISAVQCKANRQRGVFACKDCPGLVDMCPADYQPPPEKAAPAPEPIRQLVQKCKPAPVPAIMEKKEKPMGYYGTCTTCKRGKLSLPIKDTCGRCRARIKKGYDPLTGKPVEKSATPAPKSAPAPKPAPAILADDEPNNTEATDQPVPATKKAGAAGSAPTGCSADFNINVMSAIDEAWLDKRTAIITQLQAANKTSEKLRIAFHTLASVRAMGVEA